jgi:D-psicose/D-tagatose/L-ribulose 3-epimerase
MNKIGMSYTYWTQEWDVDIIPYIDKAAELGIEVLEVNAGAVGNMPSTERKNLKDHAYARNIGLSYIFGLPAEFDLASEDGAVRRNGILSLTEMARSIGEMGGGRISGVLYSCWPASLPMDVTDKRPYLDRSVASMKLAIKAAEDNNVTFNMEVVNRYEHYLMNTAQEAVDYIKQVDSPNAKILLDTFHMNIEEDNIASAVENAGSYLGHIHLGENNRKTPGYGHIPWKELVNALKKVNYQGWLVMEPFLTQGGPIGHAMRIWRDVGKGMDLDTEAGKAVRFMRACLADAD